MAIKNWHVGKLLLLWAWSAVIAVVLINVLRDVDDPLIGSLLLLAIAAAPLAMSVVTWRWFGGKEH
jgi:hypothetical protein